MPTFEELRDECLKKGCLYEDPDFPTNNTSLFLLDDKPVTWKRPEQLVDKPIFIRKATYYDINQGELGDCFFLTAVNSLLANDQAMFDKIVPKDQGFDAKYAGIFRFNFWQYGDWKEIIIDDRLPVKKHELLYSRNTKEPNEFWICLLEKAYAKLRGNYKNLDGGYSEEVLVDLTGGISETLEVEDMEYDAVNLFKMLYKMWKMDTLISAAIYKTLGKERERKRENGLLEGHAYSVTRLAQVTFENNMERLVRFRNPWGLQEWNGAWSDKSKEWMSFSEDDRKKVGLTNEEEGEFWMRIEDVMTEFDAFNFCHKEESAMIAIVSDAQAQKAKWSSHSFKDRWVKHVSSGGGNVDTDVYWRNPQYIIDLEHCTDYTWTVISLTEVMPKERENSDIYIGFDIYKLKPGVKTPPSYRFDKDSVKIRSVAQKSVRREKSRCIELPPGIFVVIAYNSEMVTCDFLMRIYCENTANVRAADDVTEPFTEEEKGVTEDPVKMIFDLYCDEKERNVDYAGLKFIIEDFWLKEFGTEIKLSVESSRCLMRFVSTEHVGVIDIKAVRTVFKILLSWLKLFFTFDRNRSMYIEISELVNLLTTMNVVAGRKVAESAAIRYGGRDGRLMLDDFLQFFCRFFSITRTYQRFDLSKLGITLDAYISEAIKD